MTRGNIPDLRPACWRSNGALIFTTEYDIFSINPNDCSQNWRMHEDYQAGDAAGRQPRRRLSRRRLFRGTQDGRVLAYDFKTGKRLWETAIADPKKGESAPAAPIAWNGLVFIGNAGGDIKGVKGRMYALDAKTGKIVWEFYLVPKSPGDVERGPQGKSPLDGSTWENAARLADHRRRDVDVLYARPGQRSALCPRRQSRARLCDRHARRRQSLHRFGRRSRRQNRQLQDPLQDRSEGLARLGCFQRARAH